MMENLGPEARIRDTVGGIARAVERLPKVVNDMEEGAALLSEGRIRLHPETVEALRQGNGTGGLVLWLALAALAGALAAFAFA